MKVDRITHSRDLAIWNFTLTPHYNRMTRRSCVQWASTLPFRGKNSWRHYWRHKVWIDYPWGILRQSTQENIVLKYQLIPTRTAGEEAFRKHGQTERQNDRMTNPETDRLTILTIRVAIAEWALANQQTEWLNNRLTYEMCSVLYQQTNVIFIANIVSISYSKITLDCHRFNCMLWHAYRPLTSVCFT